VCRGFEVEAAAAFRHDRDAGEDLRLTDGSGEQQFHGLSRYKRRQLRRWVWAIMADKMMLVSRTNISRSGAARGRVRARVGPD
jgi:hypothetical protein